jgi:hypothetical protein
MSAARSEKLPERLSTARSRPSRNAMDIILPGPRTAREAPDRGGTAARWTAIIYVC